MTALVAVVSVVVVYRSNIRQLEERQREKTAGIYKKLNSFYGPILHLRQEVLISTTCLLPGVTRIFVPS
jgi:hypothetical protein